MLVKDENVGNIKIFGIFFPELFMCTCYIAPYFPTIQLVIFLQHQKCFKHAHDIFLHFPHWTANNIASETYPF